MADSNFRGPVNSMGALEVDAATASVYPLDGPSMFYQGGAFPDIRSAPFNKDGFRAGQQPAFMMSQDTLVIDQIPTARTSTQIAAAQIVTSAVAVSLVTSQPAGVASAAGIAVGVPIVPLGTTVATFAAIAIDFGFTTGTTVSNSSTVAVVDNRLFTLGQWIVVAGAGNSSASRSLVTQVTSIGTANLTTINISPVAATGLSNVPIGQGNAYDTGSIPAGTQFGPTSAAANAHAFGGAIQAGLAKVYNPREMLSRNLSITGVTAIANAYSAVISGWDVWGVPMTELVSNAATITTYVSKKAFKYISSITSGTTVAGSQTVAFGLGDTVGLPVRMDYGDQCYVTYNYLGISNLTNGFVPAVTTPATSTTGDVRGTIALSTAIVTGTGGAALATAIAAVASNGTSRLTVTFNIRPDQQILATPLNAVPLFGVAQSTATT